ncbi:MAG TPA: hypothetical protein VNA25_14690 [Phycisphaerae bacterium]|nr:hypothetical protein [Phycisphaerae bacterium]
MAKTLGVNFSANLQADYGDDSTINAEKGDLKWNVSDSLATGTAAEQADQFYAGRRTLAATSENIDLAGGLTDAYGAALTFEVVKAILIRNRNTTAGHTLTVGAATASAFTSWASTAVATYLVPANSLDAKWSPGAGFAVNTASAKLLRIDAGTNTVVYDLLVVGTS